MTFTDDSLAPGEELVISASTLVSAAGKPALDRWTRTEIAKRTVEQYDALGVMVAGNPEMAAKYISEIHWSGSADTGLSASARGTLLHDCLEAALRGTPRPEERVQQYPEIWGHLELLYSFIARHEITLVQAERVCWNPSTGLGGRYDLIADMTVGGQRLRYLLDLKTAGDDYTGAGNLKRIYGDGVPLQLATYRYATHQLPDGMNGRHFSKFGGRCYIVGDAERSAAGPMTEVQAAGVIFLTPTRCELYSADVGPGTYEAAQAHARVWRWLRIDSRNAVPKNPISN